MNISNRPKFWQPKLNALGEIVDGVNEINQSIEIILMTRIGEDTLRPDFGCNIFQYLDRPINDIRADVSREIITALRTWEPRITVDSVETQVSSGHIIVTVSYSLTHQPNYSQQTEVSYARRN